MMKKILLASLALCIAGCARNLRYTPQPLDANTNIQENIVYALRQQHPTHVPDDVVVGEKYIEIIANPAVRSFITGGVTSGIRRTYLYYNKIAETTLHERKGWYVVTFLNSKGVILYRAYNSDIESAHLLIDSVNAKRLQSK